jgi:ATP-dependent Clp protease protease subunit
MTGGKHGARAAGRYVVPSFVERTSYGVKEMDPYNKLFEDRIIFLGVPVDDTSANDVIAQLIALEGRDPDRPISIYINSPGGSLTALMAIYDTMEFIRPEIETTCVGQAASAAAVLLAAGAPGKRAALPGARILLAQPAAEPTRGHTSDLEIQAREIMRMRAAMEQMLARHTGRTVERVRADIERAMFMTATEAQDYGLIDEIITSRKHQP